MATTATASNTFLQRLIGAAALLMQDPHPTEAAIKERMANHLCRCGVYNRVVRAVQRASAT